MASHIAPPIILVALLALGLGWGLVWPAPARAAEAASQALDQTSPDGWRRLARARIFFGHNSVGADIMRGVARLEEKNPGIGPKIIETRESAAGATWTEAGLAHGFIGENMRPLNKIEDFRRVMAGGAGESADMALLKFCYVDMEADGDPDALFQAYRQAMAELRRAWPRTIFIHATMPLTSAQTGPKAWAKTLLGRSPRGYADNAARQRFNDLVRAEYAGREPLFDLAELESSRPDGSRVFVEHGGKRVEALNPAFTEDGGHLNDAGADFVAAGFLKLLAAQAAKGV